MTLLVNSPTAGGGVAVHALVVAVGEYPHLDGGIHPPAIDTADMGQLTSPPQSAAALCNWLLSSLNPKVGQFASLDVLCSGAATFIDSAGAAVVPERATLQNLRDAVVRWYAKLASNSDNIGIFYFCGHGVTSGAVDSLLLEDFGSNGLDPFSAGAVDANAFIDGMRKCPAQNQLFLFDACRTAPDTYLREYGTQRGVSLVSAAPHTGLGHNQIALWASGLGLPAYGRQGKPSVLLEAFLSSVKGASAVLDLVTADWDVQCAKLAEGMNAYVGRILGKTRQFVTAVRLSHGFPLHVLTGLPIVPVEVACKPQHRAPAVELRCTSGDMRPVGHSGVWHLDLPYGAYQVDAHDGNGGAILDTKPCLANPPLGQVVVTV